MDLNSCHHLFSALKGIEPLLMKEDKVTTLGIIYKTRNYITNIKYKKLTLT